MAPGVARNSTSTKINGQSSFFLFRKERRSIGGVMDADLDAPVSQLGDQSPTRNSSQPFKPTTAVTNGAGQGQAERNADRRSINILVMARGSQGPRILLSLLQWSHFSAGLNQKDRAISGKTSVLDTQGQQLQLCHPRCYCPGQPPTPAPLCSWPGRVDGQYFNNIQQTQHSLRESVDG